MRSAILFLVLTMNTFKVKIFHAGKISRFKLTIQCDDVPFIIQLRDQGLSLECVAYDESDSSYVYEEVTDLSKLKGIEYIENQGMSSDDDEQR